MCTYYVEHMRYLLIILIYCYYFNYIFFRSVYFSIFIFYCRYFTITCEMDVSELLRRDSNQMSDFELQIKTGRE